MTLTSKQRRTLKGLGQRMNDDLRLGKAGISDSFVNHAGQLLDRQELIKIRFTDISGADRQALADQVSEALHAQCVGVVGRTMLIYRDNPDLEPQKKKL